MRARTGKLVVLGVNLQGLRDDLHPARLVVIITWETVDEELLGRPAVVLHCLLDQLDSDLDRHDASFDDDLVDKFSILAAAVTLLTQKVSS